MSIFAIADTHLSFSSDKPMGIFKGWNDHIQRLRTNWERLIDDDDTVVIAGDISWAMRLEGALEDFAFLNSLPGKKIIMKGNHDYWWESRAKTENFFEKNGFDTLSILHNNAIECEGVGICGTKGWYFDSEDNEKLLNRECMRLVRSIECAEQMGLAPVVFLHYPPIYDGRPCTQIMDTLKSKGISRCYYGHVHGYAIQKASVGMIDGIDFRLISCDSVGFTPVPVYI